MENMNIEQLLQEQANVVKEMLDSNRNFTDEMINKLTWIVNALATKYKEEMENYITKATNEIREINPELLKRKDYDSNQHYYISNRWLPGKAANDYSRSSYIEPPRYIGNDNVQEASDRFIKEEDLGRYNELVKKHDEVYKLQHNAIAPYRTNPKNSNAATLNYELKKLKDNLETRGIFATRVQTELELIITEEEKQKIIEEYVFARNTLETLYKEASLYNGDQKTFNETLAQLKKEIAEIENTLNSKGLLEEAKKAYNDDFATRRQGIIEQYKNKQSTQDKLNLEGEISKLQSDIVADENKMKSYMTTGDLKARINQVRGQIEADIKKLKAFCASNPNNEELKDKLKTLQSIFSMISKIQEMINKKQSITDIFKSIVTLYTAMEVANQKGVLKDTTLGIIKPLNDLGKQYEKNVEKRIELESSGVTKNQSSDEVMSIPTQTIIPLSSAHDQGQTQTVPTTEQTQTPVTPTQPPTVSPQELPTELRVEKRSAWQWVKDNKKQVLLAAGLTALTVATVVALQGLVPAIMSSMQANSVSSMCQQMISNAANWHTVGTEGAKEALHAISEGLAGQISSLTGNAAVFENATGVWKFGQSGMELGAFAKEAALAAAKASKKVITLSRTAGTLGLAGLGGFGISTLWNGRSNNYGNYKQRIKGLKESTNNPNSDFWQMLIELATEINNDNSLTDSEKRNLKRKITILYDKAEEVNYEEEETQGRGSR